MADQPSRPDRHLDAAGPREVVYCHQCEHEWYQDEHGLVCPRCEGVITEIVTPESDPRPGRNTPQTPPELRSLHNHNPWADSDVSDPEEADIEEHITHGPGGSLFISQTIRSHGGRPRGARGVSRPSRPGDPNDVMNDFQNMLGNLMGGEFRPGMTGRSGRDDLFPPPMGFRINGNRVGSPGGPGGPHVVGGHFTFQAGRLQPRNVNEPQAPPDIATLIGNIFGNLGPPDPGDHQARGGMPPGLQGLFASLLNPANARAGDAVYSQEALDQIISTLMEQHPTSNAPGPASPDAIAALPKKKLEEKELGPEGKGECSVCMDDVHIGDEVVMLPCSHWFHEPCAGAWLSEHNTCPICRKGIDGDASASPSPPSPTAATAGERPRRASLRSHMRNADNGAARRNQDRLDSIRSTGRLSPTTEAAPMRWQAVGDPGMDYSHHIPGSFSSSRRRDSEMSENQRDGRRGNTSGSDRSRDSRRSSGSTSGGGNGSGGPLTWLRDRFSGGSDRRRD